MAVVPVTVGSLIRSGMRKAGILGRGEAIPSDAGEDALTDFRQMIDSWTNESLLIPVVNAITHTFLEGYSSYTIGIDGGTAGVNHIETARPERILGAFIRDSAGTDFPLKSLDVNTYTGLSRKSNVVRPSRMYNRKGWPLNTLIFESIPTENEELHLEVIQPLSEILGAAGLTEVVNLPPGYERAITYNFALEIMPEYGKTPTNLVTVYAVESKKWLKRNNYRSLVLKTDRAIATQRIGTGNYIIDSGP